MPSQTNVTVEALRTLHRIHQQLFDLKERFARGPKVVQAHQANVQLREEQLARLREETKTLRMATDAKQVQLGGGEQKVERFRRQLNEAASNREFQTLKDQLAATEMVNSVLADEIIEALDKIDEFGQKRAQAETAFAQARERADQSRQEAGQQQPLIEGDIRRLEAELKQCEAAMPGDVRQLYQRVVRARGEDALAPVDGEFCGGCNQHIPLNMINALMLSHPVFCKACGRLLYLPEGHSAGR